MFLAAKLWKATPAVRRAVSRYPGASRPLSCAVQWAGSVEGQGDHASFCHQRRYLDGAACGYRMFRSHARSLYEVRRADLAVSPADRRSGLLP
jgi:hypothetical protein